MRVLSLQMTREECNIPLPRLIVEGRSNMVNAKAKTNDRGGPEGCDKRQLLLQKR